RPWRWRFASRRPSPFASQRRTSCLVFPRKPEETAMRVSEAMTREPKICTPGQPIREVARAMAAIDVGALPVGGDDRLIGYDDEDLERVTQGMADVRVRRLPVVNREKRLVGILSLGDVARMEAQPNVIAEAVAEVSTPGGPHRQATER